ncbi:phospholipid carrier-dependent glycosyltransferase [Trebonia kvetii]|uniref:Phospholipid carrier-dependent glycosyltransferase n=2 Tax=Trebonia kvetii TaxID=2480626 RepID=A0A6P2BXH7_9ACTN|nr:phospholipid carrier-dependent glycosyltransferase [Trebonia kvetii]TVZ02885.1 phospholipid carrier-dependent glycosyltransferase [Trebonia kvetii]
MTATNVRDVTARIYLKGVPARATGVSAAAIGVLTVLIRLAMRRSFDLFGDEVIYVDLGRSVFSGGFPQYRGFKFFLHGPAFFYLETGWAHILGTQHALMSWIYQMRVLNALLAAVTAMVIVLLAARADSLRPAVVAGLLFAFEPFCIRQNGRVMLETSMMMWVLLGYLVFIPLIENPSSPRGRLRAVAAGLLFGLAALTKDEGALLTVIPLAAAAALRWGPRRTLTLLTIGTTVATYAMYVALIAANGYASAFWLDKTTGVRRLLGLIQVTGFHSSNGISLPARLLAEGSYFSTTYLILILAVPATVIMIRSGGAALRLLGLMYCAAALALGYAVVLGTLEEQELYLLLVPSVLIIPVAARRLLCTSASRRHRGTTRRRWEAVTAAVVLGLGLSVNLATCTQWLFQPDDGFTRLLSYMTAHVPPSAPITDAAMGLSGDVGANALADYGYHVGFWVTPAARSRYHVRYVLVPWAEVSQGYSYLSPSQVRRLIRPGSLLFSFRGRTYGDLALYALPARLPLRALAPGRPADSIAGTWLNTDGAGVARLIVFQDDVGNRPDAPEPTDSDGSVLATLGEAVDVVAADQDVAHGSIAVIVVAGADPEARAVKVVILNFYVIDWEVSQC